MKKTTLLHPARRHSGFTLIELLAVIAIIAILFSIGFYANGAIVKARNQMLDQTNLRSIYQATMAYTNDNKGFLPIGDDGSGQSGETTGQTNERGGQRGQIWINFIAPYLEHADRDDEIILDNEDEFDYAVLRSPQLEDERVRNQIAETTGDVIFGYGYNVYPRATGPRGAERGNPNAIGWGRPWRPFSINSITTQSSRIMYANSYDWHLQGGARAYDFWGEDGAFVVFFDGSVTQISQDDQVRYDLGLDSPQKFVRGSE
ncbi:MAG: type II secretion system protein [Opitutales bacterium]